MGQGLDYICEWLGMPVEVVCTFPTVQQVGVLNKTSKHTDSTDTAPDTQKEMKKQPAAEQPAVLPEMVCQIITLVQDDIKKQQSSNLLVLCQVLISLFKGQRSMI